MFDYSVIIIGTSMVQNFRTFEFDKIFGVNSIKTCFVGASYKEVNDNLRKVFETEHDFECMLHYNNFGIYSKGYRSKTI